MNNNAFYEGMLSELTKTAYVLAPRPAPKKKVTPWWPDALKLGGGLGTIGLAYQLSKSNKTTDPAVSAPTPPSVAPSAAAKAWNYLKNNPGDAAKTVGSSVVNTGKAVGNAVADLHTDAYSNPLSDPSSAAMTLGLDAQLGKSLINRFAPSAGTVAKGLGGVARFTPGLYGATELVQALNPYTDMSTGARLGAGAAGAGMTTTGILGALPSTAARAGGLAPTAAYIGGSLGAAGTDWASNRATNRGNSTGDIFDFLGALTKQLRSHNPAQAAEAKSMAQQYLNDPANIEYINKTITPHWTDRVGWNPLTPGSTDANNPEMNQSIVKLLEQLRQQVNNR